MLSQKVKHFILSPQKDKDYAELMFWGDVHLGHPKCLWKKALLNLDYALAHKVYVLLMGDLVDSQGQIDKIQQMVESLKPLAKEKLLLGLHTGNHEIQITKNTGIDISEKIAHLLDIPYLSRGCLSLLQVGKFYYNLYSLHGSDDMRFKSTRLKLASYLTRWIDIDIIALGHTHSLSVKTFQSSNAVQKHTYQIVLTGSYLAHNLSQIGRAIFWPNAYPFPKIGSPKLRLSARSNASLLPKLCHFLHSNIITT